MSDPKLYDDSSKAGRIVKERAKIDAKLQRVERLKSELQTWREMHGELSIAMDPTPIRDSVLVVVYHPLWV